jgi:hypothetical protein
LQQIFSLLIVQIEIGFCHEGQIKIQEREKMKKIIAAAVGLVLVGGVTVTTASALESQFGGYWRTRSYFERHFDQEANNNTNINVTDTRTRLYYFAKFNDDLKFVNKFEFNSSWGDNNGGDIGADGKGNWRIKNSYVDATFGDINAKVGIQNATIHRGFVFADDFSGAVVTAKFGDVTVPFLFIEASNHDADVPNWDGSVGKNQQFTTNEQAGITGTNGKGNVYLVTLMPIFHINENITAQPSVTYTEFDGSSDNLWYLGTDIDAKYDAFSVWGTMIHNGGKFDGPGGKNQDISAWLFAAGADVNVFHTQAFYATGDDDNTDNDIDSFVLVGGNAYGASYYWSEILGLGVFDNAVQSNAVLSDKISNIWAVNLGVTLKPMDKMTFTFDAWYAENVEKVQVNGNNEDKLGLELDAKLSYQLMDNLTADVIYAYLFAGDAVGDSDVQEGGVQLSLSF